MGASVGVAAALALLVATCTCIAVRRRQRQSRGPPDPRKLASNRKGPWHDNELVKEATPKQHKALTAQKTAGVPSPKPADTANKDLMQPGAHWKVASPSVSEHLDSWRSPWEKQEPGQPAAVDSAKSRHNQTDINNVSSLNGNKAGPGHSSIPADSHLSSWETFPEVCLRSFMRCLLPVIT